MPQIERPKERAVLAPQQPAVKNGLRVRVHARRFKSAPTTRLVGALGRERIYGFTALAAGLGAAAAGRAVRFSTSANS
jgi:hypothetical protein